MTLLCLEIHLEFTSNTALDLHRWLNLAVVFYAAVSTSLLVYLSTLTFFFPENASLFPVSQSPYSLTESQPKMQVLRPNFFSNMCLLFLFEVEH